MAIYSNFIKSLFTQACGFVEVISGFLLLCDSRRVLLSRLLATPEDGLPEPPFYYLALALLVAGLTICAVAALGCWATYMPGYAILTMVSEVIIIIISASASPFLTIGRFGQLIATSQKNIILYKLLERK